MVDHLSLYIFLYKDCFGLKGRSLKHVNGSRELSRLNLIWVMPGPIFTSLNSSMGLKYADIFLSPWDILFQLQLLCFI